MRRTFFHSLLASVVGVALLVGSAAAQDVKTGGGNLDLASFVGTWTVAPNGDCTRSLYSWTVRGNEFQFLGPNGSVDVERVIALRPDGFTAVTISSPSNPPGTNWDFRLTAPGTFRVHNLSTGRGFDLRRCGGASASAAAPAPVGTRMVWGSHGDGGGGSLAYGVPESDDLLLLLSCTANQGTMSVTVGAPPMPTGRRVRVTVSAGGTSTSFDARADEGPTSAVYGTLPSGHPIVALLRSGEASLRISVAGASPYTVPLAGAAEHARRFEAACRS